MIGLKAPHDQGSICLKLTICVVILWHKTHGLPTNIHWADTNRCSSPVFTYVEVAVVVVAVVVPGGSSSSSSTSYCQDCG